MVVSREDVGADRPVLVVSVQENSSHKSIQVPLNGNIGVGFHHTPFTPVRLCSIIVTDVNHNSCVPEP